MVDKFVKKHSVNIQGHKTSFSLEDEFWINFKQLAKEQNISVSQLVRTIDLERSKGPIFPLLSDFTSSILLLKN